MKFFISGETVVLENGINTVTVTFEELGRINGLIAREMVRRTSVKEGA